MSIVYNKIKAISSFFDFFAFVIPAENEKQLRHLSYAVKIDDEIALSKRDLIRDRILTQSIKSFCFRLGDSSIVYSVFLPSILLSDVITSTKAARFDTS